MKLLRCVLAFSVSSAGLIATQADADVHCLRGQKAVAIGRDFHRCDPVAWICRSQVPAGHPWGEGWSDDKEAAKRKALYNCKIKYGGGEACSKPECTPGSVAAAAPAQQNPSRPKNLSQSCNSDLAKRYFNERQACDIVRDNSNKVCNDLRDSAPEQAASCRVLKETVYANCLQRLTTVPGYSSVASCFDKKR
jgi:hypothetical protein